jgi:DNA primase
MMRLNVKFTAKNVQQFLELLKKRLFKKLIRLGRKKRVEKQRIEDRRQVADQNTNTVNKPTEPAVGSGGEMDYEIPIEAFLSPEDLDQPSVISDATHQKDLYFFEYDLIRILLNYGLYSIQTDHVELDENEVEKIVRVEVPVIELILHELERDQIEFQHPVFNAILKEYSAGKAENILYNIDHFIRHENLEISSKAADIITVKYETSANWSLKKVRINTEIDKLESSSDGVLVRF